MRTSFVLRAEEGNKKKRRQYKNMYIRKRCAIVACIKEFKETNKSAIECISGNILRDRKLIVIIY